MGKVFQIDKDGKVQPGPSAKPIERSPFWLLLFAVLGMIFGKDKK